MTFTVTRSGGTTAFNVTYATADGTATTADGDYAANSNTLQFAANENTKTVSIVINGDTKAEGNETFTVNLSNATNGATIGDGQGLGTISNDDSGTIVSSVSYTLGPNDLNLVLTGTADLQGYGNAANNVINGNSGNNLIDGGAGADSMFGGAGNDTYFVDNAGDGVVENANEGNDTVFSTVHHTLSANVENLILQGSADLQGYGNSGANVIYGNAGNNLLNGGGGADLMVGGAGDDIYFVDNASDSAFEFANQGNDTVFSTANYGLAADVENLILQGSADLQGYGSSQANVIYGNSGNNLLNGGAGADLMVGGAGNDTDFVEEHLRLGASKIPPRATTPCSRSPIMDWRRTWKRWCCRAARTCRVTATARPTRSTATPATISSAAAVEPTSCSGAPATTLLRGQRQRRRGRKCQRGQRRGIFERHLRLTANVETLVLQGSGNIDGRQHAGQQHVRQLGRQRGRRRRRRRPAYRQNRQRRLRVPEGTGQRRRRRGLHRQRRGRRQFISVLGFGTAAEGATFTQIGASNQWQIHSGLDAHNETITLSNGATVHASDFLFG